MEHASLIGILTGIAILTGSTICLGQRENTNKPALGGAPQATDRNEKDLLDKLEVYAVDEGERGRQAWEALTSLPEPKLVMELTELRDKLPPDSAGRAYIAFAMCTLNRDYAANKRTIVHAFRHKETPGSAGRDDAEGMLSKLLQRGDWDVLAILLPEEKTADGALAEGLDDTFMWCLETHTKLFLRALARQSPETRHAVYREFRLVPLGESGGKIKRNLRNAAAGGTEPLVAAEMLRAIAHQKSAAEPSAPVH